jgi:hypothetical protein
MAESSLSIDYSELTQEVAYFLGYGRTTSLDTDQKADVDSCIKSGLSQFYNPPKISPQQPRHKWSFLYPVATLDTVSGTAEYTMPDDFAGIGQPFTFEPNKTCNPVTLTSINQIHKHQQLSEAKGTPALAAVVPVKGTGSSGQRWKVIFYPTPDKAYTLTYTYYVLLDMLTDLSPYPYGGAQHRETILESCLSIAESRIDDGVTGKEHYNRFISCLSASIAQDREVNSPEWLGYAADGSVDLNKDRRLHTRPIIRYNGVEI